MIYFMHVPESRAVKVGLSINVPRRLGELQTANPYQITLLGTIPGGEADEAALHDRFRDYHLRGEWFRDDPPLLREVAGLLWDYAGAFPLRDELRLRNYCRFGLCGVLVGLPSVPSGPLVVRSTKWGRDSQLLLDLDVAIAEAPADPPTLFLGGIPAADCVLLGPWPITCRCWLPEDDS